MALGEAVGLVLHRGKRWGGIAKGAAPRGSRALSCQTLPRPFVQAGAGTLLAACDGVVSLYPLIYPLFCKTTQNRYYFMGKKIS